jgi:hypothetical protein
VVTVAIAVDVVSRMGDHVGGLDLERACADILPGDSPGDVFDRLGLDGYRPGCTDETPCDHGDFGPYQEVPFLCDGDDCSLYWRVADLGCLVDWTRGSTGVEGAELLHLPR